MPNNTKFPAAKPVGALRRRNHPAGRHRSPLPMRLSRGASVANWGWIAGSFGCSPAFERQAWRGVHVSPVPPVSAPSLHRCIVISQLGITRQGMARATEDPSAPSSDAQRRTSFGTEQQYKAADWAALERVDRWIVRLFASVRTSGLARAYMCHLYHQCPRQACTGAS